jgi:anti-sigma-K factor RskA
MGRVARAAATGPNTSSPRTAATLAALQLKHPVGDPIDQLQGVEDAGHVTSQGHLAAAVAAVAAAAAAAEAVEPQQEEPLVAATAANSISAIFTVPKL